MYKPPLDVKNAIYKYLLQNPYDNIARGQFGDWLIENGHEDIGEYIVASIHGTLTDEQRMVKELNWRSWLSGFPEDWQVFVDWEDGLPSILNLAINRRPSLIFDMHIPFGFSHNVYSEYSDSIGIRLDIPNTAQFMTIFSQIFPIREIRIGVCTIYPYHKMMVWKGGAQQQIHYYGKAGYTLPVWWRTYEEELRTSNYDSPTRADYENVLRGHGNLWFAQRARAVTIRYRRWPSDNSRPLVDSIPGNASIVARHDGFEIYWLQQRVRFVPVEQAVQHVASI